MKLALMFVAIAVASGCAIAPYAAKVPPLTVSLFPPSKNMFDYSGGNMGMALQLERTTAFCGVVKQRIGDEIRARKRRQTIVRGVGAGISSGCAAAATAYTSLATPPDKRISASLSACAGGVLLAAIPSWGTDSQIGVLDAKLSAIRIEEAGVLNAKAALELALVQTGVGVIALAGTLGTALAALGNTCQ